MLAVDYGLDPRSLMDSPMWVVQEIMDVLDERAKKQKAEETSARLNERLQAAIPGGGR